MDFGDYLKFICSPLSKWQMAKPHSVCLLESVLWARKKDPKTRVLLASGKFYRNMLLAVLGACTWSCGGSLQLHCNHLDYASSLSLRSQRLSAQLCAGTPWIKQPMFVVKQARHPAGGLSISIPCCLLVLRGNSHLLISCFITELFGPQFAMRIGTQLGWL